MANYFCHNFPKRSVGISQCRPKVIITITDSHNSNFTNIVLPSTILFFIKQKNLAKSAPPLRFNIHVPSSRNVLLFCTPSFFLLYYAPILAVNLTQRTHLVRSVFLKHVTWSKTIFKHVPPSICSCWFFSPTPPIHFCILKHVPCSLIALLYSTLQQ